MEDEEVVLWWDDASYAAYQAYDGEEPPRPRRNVAFEDLPMPDFGSDEPPF